MEQKESLLYEIAMALGEDCSKIIDPHERHRITEGAILNVLLASRMCEIEQIGILNRAIYQINIEMDKLPKIDELEDLR